MAQKSWFAAGTLCAAFAVVGLAVGAYLYSDRPSAADGMAMLLPVDPAPLVAVTDGGERKFTIEIADDVAERSAGLMYRETMADDHGMLFVYDHTQAVSFWMKNTPMPLDLVFIAEDGRIRAIKKGEPQSEAVIAPDEPVRFVLELKAGTAARQGIEDGDLVRHPAIGAAAGSMPRPSEKPALDGLSSGKSGKGG
ncbi:DUF192 domain-containing protein [Mesorhizobium sp. BE184]|uniref:DUF192 domain-containing protein n=1 Tax=Mesorhizobium sp. BE184 TaxID=2817714 RepID=UPI002865DC5E|nr:DUF192 domain-containing protein [Mesorhizobium sp. BE184]MDR7031980.1 uncharacterized membrane protein (UPF0127 family) [Mesorhizobium sp. BE184]